MPIPFCCLFRVILVDVRDHPSIVSMSMLWNKGILLERRVFTPSSCWFRDSGSKKETRGGKDEDVDVFGSNENG